MFRAHCLAWLIALACFVTPNTPASAQDSNRSLRGKLIYFGQADSENAKSFWIKAQSRNGADEKIAAIEAGASSGRVSPKGDRMAFCSQHEGKCGIWLMSADGRERSLLVEASEDSWICGWSPDGTRLVYGSGDADQRVQFQIDLKTKAVTPVRLPATEVIWDWSPDGREWLTISMQADGRQIQRVRVDGSGLTRLTDPATDNISPRYSPDGKRILFSSVRTRRSQLYVMDRDGQNVRQLTKFEDRSSSNGCWSPDGREICFRAYKTGPVTESGYAVFDPEVILMNADGSDPKVFLPADGSLGWSLDWR